MRKYVIWSVLLIMFSAGVVLGNSAPSVTNITVSQRSDGSGIVDIYYTLSDADNDRCTISIQVSNDGGSTWTITPSASALDGDLINVYTGRRYITWNSKTDLPGVYGTDYRARVTAEDINLSNGLVAYYKLDGASGVVIDETGSHDGVNNGATRGVVGKVGNAFEFDGVNEDVSLQTSILPTTYNADYSVTAWVYLDSYSLSAGRCLFSQYIYRESGRYGIVVTNNKKLSINGIAYSSQDFPLNQWVFVAGTRKNGMVKGHINAIQDGSGFNTDAILNARAYLGNLNPSDNNYRWDGKIDEVRIYNRALSSAEISQLYNNIAN